MFHVGGAFCIITIQKIRKDKSTNYKLLLTGGDAWILIELKNLKVGGR